MSLELSHVCAAISPSPTLTIDTKAKELRAGGRDVVSFCAGEPDFVTPQYIRDAAVEALDLGMTRYTPVAGTIELRRAICAKLLRDNGIAYTPEQIIVSGGAKFSLYAALSAIVNPGDEVIIPTPCWVSYPEMVRIAGGVPVFVRGDASKSYVTDAADIEPFVTERTKALILNTPNNPNGCIWNREQLQGIAQLAVQRHFFIISDEIYEKLIYDGEEHVSIASLGDAVREQTLLINGISKSYAMTGWRIGYTAGPRHIIKAMSDMQSQVASCPNSIAQYASMKALTDPQGDKEIERMRLAYDARRKHIVSRINAIDGLSCVLPKGAFYVMLNVSGVLGKWDGDTQIGTSMAFATRLLERKDVAVVPGDAFLCQGMCRLSYATSPEQIDKGMDRIEAFVSSLKSK